MASLLDRVGKVTCQHCDVTYATIWVAHGYHMPVVGLWAVVIFTGTLRYLKGHYRMV